MNKEWECLYCGETESMFEKEGSAEEACSSHYCPTSEIVLYTMEPQFGPRNPRDDPLHVVETGLLLELSDDARHLLELLENSPPESI